MGSRKSDVLGRLYNKEKESGEEAWAGCWRWEVQYRRTQAVEALKQVAGSATEGEKLAQMVKAWFDARGVAACFAAESVANPVQPPARRSDDDVWLAWVRRCVQPRAREMAVRYGWRYVAEQCVGHITTYEEWETLVRGIEYELS